MVAVLALVGVAVVMALLTAGSGGRRSLGLLVGACALYTPWLAPDAPAAGRGTLAALGAWVFARAIDLYRERRAYGPWERIALAVAIFDTRQVGHAARRFDGWALISAMSWASFGVGALWAAVHAAGQVDGALHWLLRWGFGTAFVYALPETLAAAYRFVFGLAGLRLPELHRAPIASASLGEFWGQRWNRTIGAWLRRHCFLPFARRRRPGLGIATAFVASTGLHAWLAGVAVGWIGGVSMGAYFVVQGVLVWAESRVRPGPIAGRAWALLGTGLPAPLFVEPILWAFAPLVAELGPYGLV